MSKRKRTEERTQQKSEIIVNGIRFQTQSQLRKRVQTFLQRPRTIPKWDDDFSFLHSLCQRHHRWKEKSTGGVHSFRVEPRNTLFLVHEDGSSSDISWNKCVQTPDSTLTKLMRNAVQPQITIFRQRSQYICSICNIPTAPILCHVDHVLEFRLLAKQFLDENNNRVPTSFDDRVSGGCQFKSEDNAFEEDWICFHALNASLRITCRTCNLRRPRPDIVAYNTEKRKT